MLRTVLATRVRPMERPSMIVLADTALFEEHTTCSCHSAEPAVRTLVSHGVPVVLVSDADAHQVRSLQSAFGLRAPFISARGAELHVPGGYFEEILGLGPQSHDWNVITFEASDQVPGLSSAISMLLLLYWSRRQDGTVVGVSDRAVDILALSDIQILVRNPRIDQAAFRDELPEAYYTSAVGAAGWAEAILGPIEA